MGLDRSGGSRRSSTGAGLPCKRAQDHGFRTQMCAASTDIEGHSRASAIVIRMFSGMFKPTLLPTNQPPWQALGTRTKSLIDHLGDASNNFRTDPSGPLFGWWVRCAPGRAGPSATDAAPLRPALSGTAIGQRRPPNSQSRIWSSKCSSSPGRPSLRRTSTASRVGACSANATPAGLASSGVSSSP
jgi:hypothetical protein